MAGSHLARPAAMRMERTMAARRDDGERMSHEVAVASAPLTRPALAAALSFLDTSRSEAFHVPDLTAWLHTWLVTPALMPMPASVFEPGPGIAPLGPAPSGPFALGVDARLARVVGVTRVRIAMCLGGLLAAPCDDRFLT